MSDRRVDLVNTRQRVARDMRVIMEKAESEDRGFSDDEQADWDTYTAAHDDATTRLTRMDAMDAREARIDGDALQPSETQFSVVALGQSNDDGVEPSSLNATAEYAKAYDNWMRAGLSALSADDRTLMSRGAQQFAAIGGTGTGESGGFLVPTGFLDMFVEARDDIGGMRRAVAMGTPGGMITTERGEPIPFPTSDERNQEGELLRENQPVAQGDPSFGSKTLKSYVITSKMVRVPVQLMMDEQFGLDAYLARTFGKRIARTENRYFTSGAGSTEPEGVLHAASIGKTGATGSTVTYSYDDLLDLEHSIAATYRMRAIWMLSDKSLLIAKKLKDTQNRPLWLPSTREGEPDMLFGYRYVVNYNMPDPAANAKSVAFGDFGAYTIRDVLGMTSRRLDERYAENLQTGFFAYTRTDGLLSDTAAIKVYQHAAS